MRRNYCCSIFKVIFEGFLMLSWLYQNLSYFILPLTLFRFSSCNTMLLLKSSVCFSMRIYFFWNNCYMFFSSCISLPRSRAGIKPSFFICVYIYSNNKSVILSSYNFLKCCEFFKEL